MISRSQNIDYVAFNIMLDDLVFSDGQTQMGVLGGGGPQTAFGMRLWSRSVGLSSCVGPDFPAMADDWLRQCGIDERGVRRTALPTARAWQVVEANGLRTQVWRVDEDVRRRQLGRSVEKMPRAYLGAKGYHFGVHPLFPDYKFIDELNKQEAVISIESFCPAAHQPQQAALSRLLGSADIFSLNEHEAITLVGSGKPHELAARLMDAGAKVLTLRLGDNGSLVVNAETQKAFHIPAIAVPVVDAVGAGNAYCGGFLVGFCETRDLKIAGVYGAVASSFMLEQIGSPVIGPGTLKKVEERVEMLQSQVRAVTI